MTQPPLRLWICAVLMFALHLGQTALAQTAPDYQIARVEAELKKYEPAAVAAAREQLDLADNPQTRAAMAEQLKGIRQGLINALKADGETISDETADEFMDEFLKIMTVENADVRRNVILLALLESFTTEELVAMSNFYKTGIGTEIAKKISAYSIKVSTMSSQVSIQMVPVAMQAARERLRKRGKLL